ncbi:structural maintenance of chromosomes smc family member [Anaeramoeba flamelloides]|uniref:Structural maintenance of chromosomes protein n=1 Tax=Anaeramoeba flamelloides TaxID=1746091 RepID=A0ABQ8ZFX7_9EUKA|nr:structural maintenance of chromosomes smc family member [Anaeramoeba flamelloides]
MLEDDELITKEGLKIESIIISGFKCFRKKVTVNFDTFTAISGPNGSGKSTILEAICFVFGFKGSGIRVDSLDRIVNDQLPPHKRKAIVILNCHYVSNPKIKLSFKRQVRINLKKRRSPMNNCQSNKGNNGGCKSNSSPNSISELNSDYNQNPNSNKNKDSKKIQNSNFVSDEEKNKNKNKKKEKEKEKSQPKKNGKQKKTNKNSQVTDRYSPTKRLFEDSKSFKNYLKTTPIKIANGRNSYSSSYYIKTNKNKKFKAIKKSELTNYLIKFGIDLKHSDRFVIFQNRNLGIVESGPQTLLEFLEEIVGTVPLRNEIDEKNKECEILEEENGKISQKIFEISRHRDTLQPEVKKFQDYEETKRNLQEQTFDYVKQKRMYFYQIKKEIDEIIIKKSSQLKQEKTQNQDLNEQMKELETEMKKIETKRQKFDQKVDQLKTFLDRSNEKLNSQEIIKRKKEKQTESLKRRMKTVKKSIDLQKKTLKQTKEDIKKKEKSLKSFEKKQKKGNSNKNAITQEETNNKRIKQQLAKQMKSLKANTEYQKLTQQVQESQSNNKRLEKRQKLVKKKLKNLERDSQVRSDRLNNLKMNLEKHSNEVTLLDNKIQTTKEQINQKTDLLVKDESNKTMAERALLRLQSETKNVHEMEKILDQLKLDYPNRIYGFLKDLCHVDLEYKFVLNTILRNKLSSTIVVDDRDIAIEIVKQFRENRLGVVRCEILNDLRSKKNNNQNFDKYIPNNSMKLINAIELNHEKFYPVFFQLTKKWLISDVKTAEKMSLKIKKFNFATKEGDLFYSDGEINGGYRKPTEKILRFQILEKNLNKSINIQKGNYQEIQEKILFFKKEIGKLNPKIKETQRILKRIKSELKQLQNERIEKNTLINNSQSEVEALTNELKFIYEKKEQINIELQQIKEEIETFTMSNNSLEKLNTFNEKITKLELAIGETETFEKSIMKLNKEIKRLINKKTRTKSKLNQINENHSKLKNEIEILENEININIEDIKQLKIEEKKSRRQWKEGKQELSKFINKKKKYLEQIEQIEEKQQIVNSRIDKMEFKIKDKNADLNKVLKDQEEFYQQFNEIIKQIKLEERIRRKEIKNKNKKLKKLENDQGDGKSKIKDNGKSKGKGKGKGIDMDIEKEKEKENDLQIEIEIEKNNKSEIESDLESDIDSDIESDIESDLESDIRSEMEMEMEIENNKIDKENLELLLIQIKDFNKKLQQMEEDINVGVLEEDLNLQKKLIEEEKQKKKTQLALKKTQRIKEKIETQRRQIFQREMNLLNNKLSEIYKKINFMSVGDCYLQFNTIDPFSDGVYFKVKPDKSNFKLFQNLSGGQKSLAVITLSLSIQQVYSTSFFIWDEFDSALDGFSCDRLGKFIQQYSNDVQFIVVSHRPQLFEKSSLLIGTYDHNKTSQVAFLFK